MSMFVRANKLAVATCLIAAVACVPAHAAQISAVNVPSPRSCGTQEGGGDGDCLAPKSDGNFDAAWLILPAALLIWAVTEIFGTNGIDSADKLDENGPRASSKERLGRYAVQGLAYPGWQVVVEARWQPGATTVLQIETDEGAKIPPLLLSSESGRSWRDDMIRPYEQYATENGTLSMFNLPKFRMKGDGFQGARYAVLSGLIKGPDDKPELAPLPLEVFEIGAGPNAVGSAALVIRDFTAAPDMRRANYTVMYNKVSTFQALRAELVTRTPDKRHIARKTVQEQDLCSDRSGRDLCLLGPPGKPFLVQGAWPQQPAAQLGPGSSYHMNLRAWSKRHPQGGWIVAQAPQVLAWR